MLEALISGAVDIGCIGEAPLPSAVGAGVKDLVAIGIYANPGSPENYYLVAQPDRGIKAVADLKGRTVLRVLVVTWCWPAFFMPTVLTSVRHQ